MRVGVHGVRYAGMAQDLLNNLGVLALFEHKGGKGVPEVVGASGFRQASCAHERLEGARVARGDRQDRDRLLPRLRGRATVPLPLPYPRARGLGDDGQRQGGRALNGGLVGALGDPAQERLSREPHDNRGG